MTHRAFRKTAIVAPRRRSVLALVWLAGILLGASAALHTGAEPDAQDTALLLTIDGTIGPATTDYLDRGLAQARAQDASLVIIRLDTPGGLAASMRDMIQTILAAPIPVATYVAPPGARAASAGTYLLYASHIAAMAPATHLGSATPVQMGSSPEPGQPQDDPEQSEEARGDGRRGQTAMERKVLEDAVAYIRGLAERHGRNADWAEEAVREAVNLPAEEAAQRNVIELVAADIPALLREIDGRTVQMSGGERLLETAGLQLDRFDPDWRTRLLSFITNPNVAYFLMVIGFYGLIFELASPGTLVPGVIGALCLILALFAFQVLSINYAGFALVVLGLAFIVAEAFVASFGILGLGGIVAFVAGSIILMDGTGQPVSWPLIGGTAAVGGGFMLWTVSRFVGLRKRRASTGRERMLGAEARVLETFHRQEEGKPGWRGKVLLQGETWRAVSDRMLSQGDSVRVTRTAGLEVQVEPLVNPARPEST